MNCQKEKTRRQVFGERGHLALSCPPSCYWDSKALPHECCSQAWKRKTIFLIHPAGHIVCTTRVFTSAEFCSNSEKNASENNWLRQFCWTTTIIHVGLYDYFLTYCFSLGIYSQPEQGNSQEWFFLFRLSYWDDISNKQTNERTT